MLNCGWFLRIIVSKGSSMTNSEWVLLMSGAIIVAALSCVAFYYVSKVRSMERDKDQRQQAQQSHVLESLTVIAGSVIDGQVEPIEGCIRIKVLLDNLEDGARFQQRLMIFSNVYDQVAFIPTHEAWKALPKNERKQYEDVMTGITSKSKKDIVDACRDLRSAL